jgi:hypothetical protein
MEWPVVRIEYVLLAMLSQYREWMDELQGRQVVQEDEEAKELAFVEESLSPIGGLTWFPPEDRGVFVPDPDNEPIPTKPKLRLVK